VRGDTLVPVIAGPPRRDVDVPDAVAAVAGGRAVRAVWENESGGVTFAVGAGSGEVFVKWVGVGSRTDLDAEAARLTWAARYHPVPRVLARGSDDSGRWLVTAAMAGESAGSERWLADPARAVAAVGSGLRALHDTLPVAGCPFSWSAGRRLNDARRRAATGAVVPATWHDDHRALGLERALEALADVPEVDRLVVCHGDACVPNTLVTSDGRCSGHVDLGALGVADRWADLAVATWSTRWNYGAGWEELLLAAYGVDPDPLRTRYYRLLWDLGPS
jgi:kanamycin kinase